MCVLMVYVEVLFFMGFSQIKYRLIDPVARYIIQHNLALRQRSRGSYSGTRLKQEFVICSNEIILREHRKKNPTTL